MPGAPGGAPARFSAHVVDRVFEADVDRSLTARTARDCERAGSSVRPIATVSPIPVLTIGQQTDMILIMLGVPIRDRAAERRATTRREILDAAWTLARERGLTDWALRDVGDLVGMRAPSLYSHFSSKLAIYDAMFGEAWSDYEQQVRSAIASEDPAGSPRRVMKARSHLFFDFAVADLPRYQLMNQRSVTGFTPSEESFAPSQRVVQLSLDLLAALGVTDRGDAEIWFALLGGLIDQQLANDPAGHSRKDLLDRAVDMWADSVGLAKETTPSRARRKR